jgi:hypothetical protein
VEVSSSYRLRFDETPDRIIADRSQPITSIKLKQARVESQREKSLGRAYRQKEQIEREKKVRDEFVVRA